MNELVRRGKVKPEEIDSSPYKQYKNAVTRAVGVYESVEVETFDLDVLPGDNFLLCSDGLYAYFEDETLPQLLSDGDVKEVPRRLVDLANSGGGHDNITGVIIRVGDAAASAASDLSPSRAGDISLKLEVLKGMQMFRYLSYRELVRVMNIAETMEVAPETEIFREGQPGDSMYVVMSGTVKLFKSGAPITELAKGQHFGEMSLVDRSVRSLTAAAGTTPVRLAVVRRKDFYDIIRKEPELAVKLLWSFVQVLGVRLRKTTSDLSEALQGDTRASTLETTAENLFQD
jgi:CRP-like cAMP-binding protein